MSSSSVVSLKKYDVFLSFRGEDTRSNFTSHLYHALCQKKLEIFKDDNGLEKGDEISTALIKAIEESYVSIVIFSKDYASSKWCLNELLKILECRKDQGQLVIPIFYNIDPSHVRKQTGSFKQAFAKHERDWKLNKDKLQKWKDALTEAANLVGWDSQNRIESDLIKNIVEDVLHKLHPVYSYEIKGLVGIEKKYEQIKSFLSIGSNDVRTLGIWGMGGIGKTTLAAYLYDKLYLQFEGCYFLPNVRDASLDFFRNKLFSLLLLEDFRHGALNYMKTSFLMRRLACKRVLIVLDDVATSNQLEIINELCLGPGSRVIVTTRDKHILSQVDGFYEVKKLNFHDSLQLFCLNAFREKHPKIGYEDLSESIVDYCKGVPFALKALGAGLHSRGKVVWKSELEKVQKTPNEDIHNVLKLSYDDLDRTQKAIFLDIACFLKGNHRDFVTSLLEACGFFPASGIEFLLDKALIQLERPPYSRQIVSVGMHDLIQAMGQEIVNQESKDPGKRSRLWRPEEVCNVLKNNKGTEVVEAITFDTAQVAKLRLSPDSFKGMTSLRYLEIYDSSISKDDKSCNVYFPNGLGWLSDRLRYLSWRAFSLESLPPSFCAKMLVELRMPHSQLKKLWDGVQDLVNLKEIDLYGSKDLIEVPNLSQAPNLEKVQLSYCESLRQLHPSILHLPKLTHLHLQGCKKIECLKTNSHSKSLRELYLSECSSLTEFLVTSEEMTKLWLDGTAILELPSSIWCNSKLTHLNLSGCNDLVTVGHKLSNDPGLSLTWLDLSGCSQINASNLWSILNGIRSLERLDLRACCNLEAIPDNIQNLSMLQWLRLDDCRKLESLPDLPPSLEVLRAANCTSLDTDFTQRPVLENMLQIIPNSLNSAIPLNPEIDGDDFFFFPGAQVTGKFGFHTSAGASITIPLIPKSGLHGFIFCIILSEGLKVRKLGCNIYEHGNKVDSCFICPQFDGTLISNHVLLSWHGNNMQTSTRSDHYNLSFKFKLHKHEQYRSMEGTIKGCGIFPVWKQSLVQTRRARARL